MKRSKLKWRILVAAGIIYYLVIRYTDFSIPCLFYKITHLKCPGCGITHMIYELSLFHWRKAMQANYFLFWTAPLLMVFFLYETILKSTQKKKQSQMIQKIEISYLVAVILWMLVRNIIHI